MRSKQEIKALVERRWIDRAKAQRYEPGSNKYGKLEVEFFAGALAAIDACDDAPRPPETLSGAAPVSWVVRGMSGQPIVDQKGGV